MDVDICLCISTCLILNLFIEFARSYTFDKPPWWLSGRAFASHAGDHGSIPGRDRPKLLKHVLTALLTSARQRVPVLRVLGDYYYTIINGLPMSQPVWHA